MDFKKTTLPNGLRIILVPEKTAKTAAVFIMAGTGSKYENKQNKGISHFLEHLFFKGTKKRPSPLKIAETLDRVGGSYNAFTGKELTGYYAKVAKEHLDLALDFVADIFLNSKLESKDIAKERGVIIEEINMYLDSPMKYVAELWEVLLYGDQPAGWETIGTKENILRFQRKDFLGYFQNHYSVKNSVVCVAGNFNKQNVVAQIKKQFQKASAAEPKRKLPVRESQARPGLLVKEKKTDQTHLCLGARAFSLLSEKRYAQQVLATILGGNMSSRLFTEVREKRGLAYYVSTVSETYTDSGYVMTQAGVPNNKTKEAIKVILKEYQKIKQTPVSSFDLKKAKDYLQGSLVLGLESSDALASFFASQELLLGKILTASDICAKINKVTAKEVQRLAAEIFQPQRLNLALIGPHQSEKDFQTLWNSKL